MRFCGMTVTRVRWIAALAVVFGLMQAATAAADPDVVVTTTGERLVGDIKKVEKGVLTMSTGYSDSDFKIAWGKVASIESSRQFGVETFAGRRVTGTLRVDPATKGTVNVGDVAIALADVSAMQPFERTFWSRFDVGLDFGYSMTQANSAKQLTLGSNLLYRDPRHVDTLLANVFKSSQAHAVETKRWDVGNDFRYLLGARWYANTTQDFLNSDQQKLDLRTTIGGGAGRYLLRSASQYLTVGGGIAWTNENYSDPAIETRDSTEAYLGAEFMTQKLKVADLLTRFTYFPSLTIDNRYRINYRFDLAFNLPGDWYFRTGVFENFDSLPPAGLSRNDYGWSNTFGFKF